MGDAIRKLSVLIPPQAPESLQPVTLHRFDRRYGAVHPDPSAAARSGRAASVPARPPATAWKLCLSPPRGPHRFLRRRPPALQPGLGRPPTCFAHPLPARRLRLTPARPGTQVRGRRRRTAARLFQPDPEGSARVPFRGSSESPRFQEPHKASPAPTPYLN